MKSKKIRKRLKKCLKCKHLKYRKSLWRQCTLCGCLVSFKVLRKKSMCPKGKW